MKQASLITLTLCLLSSTYAEQPKESKRPVKVFLLAGQSNMEGQGVVSMDDPRDYNGGKGNLVNTMKDPKQASPRSEPESARTRARPGAENSSCALAAAMKTSATPAPWFVLRARS